MNYALVQWALVDSPVLKNGRGNNVAARINLIARCEMQRSATGTHYLSHVDLSFRTGLSHSSIVRSNRDLEQAGLLSKVGVTAAGVDIYRINVEHVRSDDLSAARARRKAGRVSVGGVTVEPPETLEPGCQGDTRGGVNKAQRGCHGDTQTVPRTNPVSCAATATPEAEVDSPGLFGVPAPEIVAEKKASEKAPRSKALTSPPDSMAITPSMRAWATEKGIPVNLESETEQFLDWHRGKGSKQKDWVATWRTWMRRTIKPGPAFIGRSVPVAKLPTPAVGGYSDNPFGATA